MSKTTVPADDRVQVVSQSLLEEGALTIRNDEAGTDIRVFGSEDDEGVGFPLRSDDEWAIRANDDPIGEDGLWMETETSSSTDVQVLKGIPINRNVRRQQSATIDADTSGLLKTSDQPLDVSDATVSVQEATALDVSGATVPTNLQTPVGVEDSTGTQVDPAKSLDGTSTRSTTTATGEAEAASQSLPDGRSSVTAAWDLSGSATVTVEVSPDGGSNWYQEYQVSPGSAETGTYNFTTGFEDVRVYVDSNLNSAAIGGKGA